MYEKFTDRARKSMQLANQAAQSLNHEYIGPEHILLGLIKEGTGIGCNVLRKMGIEPGNVANMIRSLQVEGPNMVTMGKLSQTPRARKVLEHAVEAARDLNHNYVGTEHLLIGCVRETDGVAHQVLCGATFNVTEEKIVAEFCKLVERNPLGFQARAAAMRVVPKKPPTEKWGPDSSFTTEAQVAAASKIVAEDMRTEIRACSVGYKPVTKEELMDAFAMAAEKERVELNAQIKECALFVRRRWATMTRILQDEVADKFPEVAPWINWTGPAPLRDKKPLPFGKALSDGDAEELLKALERDKNKSVEKCQNDDQLSWLNELAGAVTPAPPKTVSVQCNKCGKEFEADVEPVPGVPYSAKHALQCYACRSR